MILFRRSLLLGLAALWLSAGCAQRQIRPTEEAVKKDASLEELLHLYRSRREALGSFKGLLEVTTRSPKHGGRSLQATWISQGDETRIRGFDLLGGTLFDLRLAGPALSLSIPSEGKRFEGSRDEFKRENQGKIPIGSFALLDWMGRAGLPEIPPGALPALEKGDDFFILYLLTPAEGRKLLLDQKIWIERTAFRVKRVETFDPSGARRTLMTFDHYRSVGPVDFPFTVEGEGEKGKVTLNFREVSQIKPSASPAEPEKTP